MSPLIEPFIRHRDCVDLKSDFNWSCLPSKGVMDDDGMVVNKAALRCSSKSRCVV